MITKETLQNSLASGSGGKLPITPTYATSTTMTLKGDYINTIFVGAKIIIDDNGTLKYGYVGKTTFSVDTTTISITDLCDSTGALSSNLSGSTINGVWISNVGSLLDHPVWCEWNPPFTGFSSAPSVDAKFMCQGRSITCNIDTISTGTSSGGSTSFAPPTNITIDNSIQFRGQGVVRDNAGFHPGHLNSISGIGIRFRKVTGGSLSDLGTTTVALYTSFVCQIEQ